MLKTLWSRLTTHPILRDRAAAITYFVLGLILLQFGAWPLWASLEVFEPSGVWFLVTLTLMAVIIQFRSRAPIVQFVACSLVLTVDILFGGSLGTVIIFTDSVFSAVRYSTSRALRWATWGTLALAMLAVVALVVVRPPDVTLMLLCAQLALLLLASGAWGWTVRSEHERTRTQLSAAHLAANQQLRTRVAHDLHDLVANHIAVAGLHIEAAKLQSMSATGRAQLAASLEQAKRGTDHAHAELRSLITLLTEVDRLDASDPIDTSSALMRLDDLVPEGRGLQWETHARTKLTSTLGALNDPVARVILRVLSELIANAVKHGSGDVTAKVTVDAKSISVTIENQISRLRGQAVGTGIGVSGATALVSGVGGSLTCEDASMHGLNLWRATVRAPLRDDEVPT